MVEYKYRKSTFSFLFSKGVRDKGTCPPYKDGAFFGALANKFKFASQVSVSEQHKFCDKYIDDVEEVCALVELMAENTTVDTPYKPKSKHESKLEAAFAESSGEQVCSNCGRPRAECKNKQLIDRLPHVGQWLELYGGVRVVESVTLRKDNK